ncbi:MAG: molybdopterin-dependent oxidoreductase [Chloroflexi bacterium]|nr:molybdopterin-dependent oxidoreductase [Chloroflexota bacterium]
MAETWPAEAGWDQALEAAASRLSSILTTHGPESVGVITGGRCSNEENYLLQKFARAILGTNNIDQSPYLCYSPTIAAFHKSFGVAAATNSGEDLQRAGCIFVVGSNPFASQRITSLKIDRAARQGARLIVANPKGTESEKYAHLVLRLRPGSDLALVQGMMKVIVEEELWNRAFVEEHCEGFEQLAAGLRALGMERISAVTGLRATDIRTAARLYALGGRDPEFIVPPIYYGILGGPAVASPSNGSCLLFGTGVTQQPRGEEIVQMLINLALLTGQIGRPGAGLGPFAGQNNMQGSVDMGVLPNLLPGQAPIADPAARARFAEAWGSPIPDQPGMNLLEMIAAAGEGRLKALYVVGANPALSAPDIRYVRECLQRLELLIVQDIFPTPTAQLAHIILPAASYAEKEGTFTNTERRVQRVRPVVRPTGQAWPDWMIICELAKRVIDQLPKRGRLLARFHYSGPAEVMGEIARLVPQYGGIRYDRLEERGIQWPCPDLDHPGSSSLFNGSLAERPIPFFPLAPWGEPSIDPEYPYVMATGRLLQHYGTGSETTRSASVMEMWPECFLEIGPHDARSLGLEAGDKVRVRSRQGELVTRVRVNEGLAEGQFFLPFHFPATPANLLTQFPDLRDIKMPPLKDCRVRLEKLDTESS